MQSSSSDAGSRRTPGWAAPEDGAQEPLAGPGLRRRGHALFNGSPLARKIVVFNLLGLLILVAGMLYANPFRESLATLRLQGLHTEAALIADILTLRGSDPQTNGTGDPDRIVAETLEELSLSPGVQVFVYAPGGGRLVATTAATTAPPDASGPRPATGCTEPSGGLRQRLLHRLVPDRTDFCDIDATSLAGRLAPRVGTGGLVSASGTDATGEIQLAVAQPLLRDGRVAGVVAVVSAAGEIDRLVREQRQDVLKMVIFAILVSIGLSLLLASTIAKPLSDLARAAENGREPDARRLPPARVRIPDLTARHDEVGRLSGALRGMVGALYDRIDANEQFAADVAHEIKNPLASLRSAVGTMRVAQREDQREKLLEVIEHDVRRLDRLVSDISNASRLDSELVKEEEERFDLLALLGNLARHHAEEASRRGIRFITDLPEGRIEILGLEARLAQVFVNLITNALSLCDEGDAVRIWVRRRGARVLAVFEDTGPGIPEAALSKIFERFYSERPAGQFGDHSGLGLAISKQIVEAHGGVIWAENIRPTDADITSEPLGARFVVGLPL
ncbi:sensor histidine kinase [Tropicimonas sp. IMCC34043]|uniref:sensor histidine kinase n=1 Tax=Tropicimonas sp. IMCC34043 TaxID=2248760 RepID=UPI000E24945E|nr:sensor histidine kinase [Tropicimonas sp. IMCC34043]